MLTVGSSLSLDGRLAVSNASFVDRAPLEILIELQQAVGSRENLINTMKGIMSDEDRMLLTYRSAIIIEVVAINQILKESKSELSVGVVFTDDSTVADFFYFKDSIKHVLFSNKLVKAYAEEYMEELRK